MFLLVDFVGLTGSHIQKYYLLANYNTFFVPFFGPFYWDKDTKSSAHSESLGTLNYGAPRILPVGEDWIEQIMLGTNTFHGQHSVEQVNVKGRVTALSGAITDKTVFEPATVAATGSDDYGDYWFFPVNQPQSLRIKQPDYDFDSQISGYKFESSELQSPSQFRRDYSTTSSFPYARNTYFYPADGRKIDFVISNSIHRKATMPAGMFGTFTKEATILSMPGYLDKYEHVITNFAYPNHVTVHTKYYHQSSYSDPGTLQETDTNIDLVIVPVTQCASCNTNLDLHSLKCLIDQPLHYLSHCKTSDGALAQQAVTSVNYVQCNMLENGKDWISIKENLPPIKAIMHPMKPKNLAEIYLWYKYSFIPNCYDIADLASGVKQAMASWNRPKGWNVQFATDFGSAQTPYGMKETRNNCRVRFRHQCHTRVQELNGKLKQLGLAPTPENLWDLVPFSFVVDWFLPVGDALAQFSYNFDRFMNQYEVNDVIISHKTVLNVQASQIADFLSGDLEYISYNRSVSANLPPNDLQFGSSNPLKHIFEGTALIVANW